MLPSLLIALVLANSGNTLGVILEGRAQSQVKCSDDFNWAQNSNKETPCLVAARILGFCTLKDWIVPALDNTHQYALPNNITKNLCSCSWATYNLLSACTACQGFDAIPTWPGYKTNCASADLSDTGYPFAQLPFPPNTAIPYWAMTDPLTWPDQKFDVAAAKALDEKGQPDTVGNPPPPKQTSTVGPDTVGNPPPPKKTSTVGPIVGGVIGGLAAVGLALGTAFFIKSHKKKQHHRGAAIGTHGPGHVKNKSDMSFSQTSDMDMNIPYTSIQTPQRFARTQLSHPPINHELNIHAHDGSVDTLLYNGSIAANTSRPNYHQATNLENIVVSSTLISSQGGVPRQDRTDRAIIPVSDQPGFPPQFITSNDMLIASTTSKHPEIKISAYNPYPNQEHHDTLLQTPARSHAPPTKQNSTDTQHSRYSARSGRADSGGSISTFGDIIGQMGFDTTSTVSGRDGTVATGHSGNMAYYYRGLMAPLDPDSMRHNLA